MIFLEYKQIYGHRYYGKAAPFVRLYMDTMHGSIADTSFFMGEGFTLDAAFLTPLALLTSAGAFVDGRAVPSHSLLHVACTRRNL